MCYSYAIMGPEVLAYPFLFIAIFFESFILVTLLSEPARLARTRAGRRMDVPHVTDRRSHRTLLE